jgi:putative membrane protein
MHRTKTLVTLAFMGASALALAANAQPPSRPPSTAQPPAPRQQQATKATSSGSADLMFIREAAMGGMAEVELGRLASQKADNAEVKQFGQRMVDDHGKANDELKQAAQSKNITLPAELAAKHKALQKRLEKLNGAAFDRAYMREMVADHNKDVAAFERESKSGNDPQIKEWATKTLPTLKEHQAMAKDINNKLVAGTSGRKPAPKKPGR